MSIIINASNSNSLNLSVLDGSGVRRNAVSVGCHIRPDAGMSISVDIQDKTAITDDNRAEIAEAVTAFIHQELARAADNGIPVSIG